MSLLSVGCFSLVRRCNSVDLLMLLRFWSLIWLLGFIVVVRCGFGRCSEMFWSLMVFCLGFKCFVCCGFLRVLRVKNWVSLCCDMCVLSYCFWVWFNCFIGCLRKWVRSSVVMILFEVRRFLCRVLVLLMSISVRMMIDRSLLEFVS